MRKRASRLVLKQFLWFQPSRYLVFLLVISACSGSEGEIAMKQQNVCDFRKLDNPRVLAFVFHPQKDRSSVPPAGALDYYATAADGIRIGCRFYIKDAQAPSILFFHGNGEIVSDYDDIGPVYNSFGLNLLAVDFRGYGKSDGTPTVTAMLSDAHVIFQEVRTWLKEKGMNGPLWVMGRSLGCVSALELASTRGADISGVIIESGFAYTVPLLKFLGVDADGLGIKETDCFSHVEKIERVTMPTLIIHAQYDQFIPISDAQTLLKHSAAQKKQLMEVKGADHNSVIMKAGKSYFETIRQFITK